MARKPNKVSWLLGQKKAPEKKQNEKSTYIGISTYGGRWACAEPTSCSKITECMMNDTLTQLAMVYVINQELAKPNAWWLSSFCSAIAWCGISWWGGDWAKRVNAEIAWQTAWATYTLPSVPSWDIQVSIKWWVIQSEANPDYSHTNDAQTFTMSANRTGYTVMVSYIESVSSWFDCSDMNDCITNNTTTQSTLLNWLENTPTVNIWWNWTFDNVTLNNPTITWYDIEWFNEAPFTWWAVSTVFTLSHTPKWHVLVSIKWWVIQVPPTDYTLSWNTITMHIDTTGSEILISYIYLA